MSISCVLSFRTSLIRVTTAIQLAKLSGFSPIITTASPHNTDFLVSLGATHVIDRSSPTLSSDIIQASNGAQIKLVLDTISDKGTQTLAWDLVSPGGTLSLVLPPEVDEEKYKDKTLFFMRGFVEFPENRTIAKSLFSSVKKLLEEGTIKVKLPFK